MKRLMLLALAPLALGSLAAQERIVATRIYATGPCAKNFAYYVDGKLHFGPATLFWPEHSKHIITVATSEVCENQCACSFTGWRDNIEAKADGPSIAVTAHRDITFYEGATGLSCPVWLQFHTGGNPSFSCTQGPEYGKVYVGGRCHDSNAKWCAGLGSKISLQAYPPPAMVFVGWGGSGFSSQSFEASVVVNGPLVIQPRFEPAVRVTILTDPPELQVLADRTPVTAPVTLDWGQNTAHWLGPVSPQMDSLGRYWIFDSWAHGGGTNHEYKVTGPANVPVTLTGRYVRGANVSFLTNPPGLNLVIDGRDNWPSFNYVWGLGATHRVSAPAEQIGPGGRRYAFQSWSNEGAATQDVTVPSGAAAAGGLRLIVNYEMLARLTVQSSHEVGLTVNGSACRTPCTIEPRQGTQVRVAAPAAVVLDEWRRLDFQGWADGAPAERSWTAGPAEQTLVVSYRPSYRVQFTADPAEGAALRAEPPSADGFYPADSDVILAAEPNPGFRLKHWEGDSNGAARSLAIRASSPRQVRVLLERVPYIAPSGVRNAAAETPEPGMAAGSLIAVYGLHLAPQFVQGPASPLAQAIAGVTARVGERILPLVFVSPEQINALLPSDLPEGQHTLAVRPDAQPDVSAIFMVVRNAPGLFMRAVDARPLALAMHEDGSLIGFDSPARRGETVTLLGTGFGPYQMMPPDGFLVPAGMRLALADPVEIPVGERTVQPVWAGAATGHVGVTAVQVRIGEEFPAATNFELRVRVNGRESNTVLLPIE